MRPWCPVTFSSRIRSHQEHAVDKFKELSLEALVALAVEKREALDALFALKGTPTPEQAAEAESLATEIDQINTCAEEKKAEAAEAVAKFEALKNKFSGSTEGETTEEAAAETTEEASAEESEEASEEEVEETPEVEAEVTAKGGKVEALAAKSKRPETPQRSQGPVTITAAANVDGFSTGEKLGNTLDISKAVIAKAKGFAPPSGDGSTENLQKFGTAMLGLDFPEDLIVDRNKDPMEVMARAVDEARLPGGNLVAAGGWCAPSETVYDLTQDATTEGMLSLPEIGVRRGGIRFAASPTFADFYANPGFIQTEAQAIAGTAKPCIEVNCPSFSEVRLDAEGICVKVPILTNAGYPEYVRNFVDGSLIGHQHWINANVIGRIVTAAGAARVFAGLGSTSTDTLGALELVGDQTRQKYRLSMNRTIEVVLPFWVRGTFRQDISRRTGQPLETVSDQQINSLFKARKLNPQWVYDWQGLDETAEVYPGTYNVVMYPAGTFVKGTADVINLSTVYDAASLAQNTYTGLFVEQGLLVAKQKFHADLVTLPICNAGRTGAANLTCA
jgi:hypothetical protein